MRPPARSGLPFGFELERDDRVGTWCLVGAGLRLSGAVLVEHVRLALPRAFAPHMATPAQLTRTPTRLVELSLGVAEGGLNAWLADHVRAGAPETGVGEIFVRFQPGAAHLLAGLSDDAWLSARVFAAPATGTRIALALHEYAGFVGRIPSAARPVLDFDLAIDPLLELLEPLASDLDGVIPDHLASAWRRDGIRLVGDPTRAALAWILAPLGWRLPTLPEEVVTRLAFEDGGARLVTLDAALAARDGDDARVDLPRAPPPGIERARLELDQTARLLEPAIAAFRAGDTGAALDRARAVVRRVGPHRELVAWLGELLLASGCPDEARELAQRSLRERPGDVGARLLAARTRDDPEDAAALLREALGYLDGEARPLERAAATVSVAALEADAAPRRAVVALREATRLAPGWVTPLTRLADLAREAGDHDAELGALADWQRLARSQIERARVHARTARVLAHLGADEDARATLDRALAASPRRDLALLDDLLAAADALGAREAALELCDRLARAANLADQPALEARARVRAADLWLRLDRPDAARAACHEALASDPTCAEAIEVLVATTELPALPALKATLADLLHTLDARLGADAADAEAAVRAAAHALVQLDPEAPAALLAWRRLFRADPAEDDAFHWLERTFRTRDADTELLDLYQTRFHAVTGDARVELAARLVERYQALGLAGDSLRWLDTLRELAPTHATIGQRQLELLRGSGRHLDLREALLHRVERVPDTVARVALLREAGELSLRQLRDPAAAAAALGRAAALAPRDAELLHLLRRARAAHGDVEGVVRVLERLAETTTDPRTRRTFLIEAGDALFDRLRDPGRAWRFYRDALAIAPDSRLEARMAEARPTDSARAESARAESARAESARAESARAESARAESARAESARAESARAESARADSPAQTDVGETLAITPNDGASVTSSASTDLAVDSDSGLPTPVSEELEITLLADSDKLGLHLSQSDLDEVLTSSPTPSSEVRVPGELSDDPPRFRRPTEADSAGEVVVSNSARDGQATASGQVSIALPSARAAEPDAPDAGFDLPPVASAPDWRAAASQWVERADQRTIATGMPAVGRPTTNTTEPSEPPARVEDDEILQLERAVTVGRRAGEPEVLADALEALLEALDDIEREMEPGSDAEDRWLRVQQELGCLCFFELDNPARACELLETVLMHDPDGIGVEAETLAALEGAYEDLGRRHGLADVYEHRLAHLDENDEMWVVYTLLAARLRLELEAPNDARRHLVAVLQREPDHRAALEVLAELELAHGRMSAATAHLEHLVAVAESPEEEAKLRIRLAGVYERDGRVPEARRSLLRAIRGSAEPLGAVEELKRLCRVHDDWHGLLSALVREFAIRLGPRVGVGDTAGLDALVGLDPSAVPAAAVFEVVQSLREIADVLSLKLEAEHEAWVLYGHILALVEDDGYALERRVILGRNLGRTEALAPELVRLAAQLISRSAHFDALADAAVLYRDALDDRLRARELFERAASLYADGDREPPKRMGEVTDALAKLEDTVVVRVSLGTGAFARPRTRSQLDPPFDPIEPVHASGFGDESDAAGASAGNPPSRSGERPDDDGAAPDATGLDLLGSSALANPDATALDFLGSSAPANPGTTALDFPSADDPPANPDTAALDLRDAGDRPASPDRDVGSAVPAVDTPRSAPPGPASGGFAIVNAEGPEESGAFIILSGETGTVVPAPAEAAAAEPASAEAAPAEAAPAEAAPAEAAAAEAEAAEADHAEADHAEAEADDSDSARAEAAPTDARELPGSDTAAPAPAEDLPAEARPTGAAASAPSGDALAHPPDAARVAPTPDGSAPAMDARGDAASPPPPNPIEPGPDPTEAEPISDALEIAIDVEAFEDLSLPASERESRARPGNGAGSGPPSSAGTGSEPTRPPGPESPAAPSPAAPSPAAPSPAAPSPAAPSPAAPSPETALREIDAALATNPSRIRRLDLLTRRGVLLAAEAETRGDGLISLRAALALDLNHIDARRGLVEALALSGEFEQALNHLVVLVQRAGDLLRDAHARAELAALADRIVDATQGALRQRARTLRSRIESP